MRRRPKNLIWRATTAALVAGASHAQAVIVFDGDGRNESAPAGSLLSAWNLQGKYRGHNATPISPTEFITARHIGGQLGIPVEFAGGSYNVVGARGVGNAENDLTVFSIDSSPGAPRFPTYAHLWDPSRDGSEVGKIAGVFGRGTQRGQAIYAALPPGPIATPTTRRPPTVLTASGSGVPSGPTPPRPGNLRGWQWGVTDSVASWGRNEIDAILNFDAESPNDTNFGDLLTFSFNSGPDAVADEASLSGGDSGGGLFLYSTVDQVWKLAGVHLSTDGPFSYDADGPYFNASVFDARGLYTGSRSDPYFIGYDPAAIAGSSYSTRIGAHVGALRSIINTSASGVSGPGSIVPEPTSLLMLSGLVLLAKRHRR